MGLNSTDLFVVQSQSDNKLYKLSLNDLQAAIEGGSAVNFRGIADLITQMPGQINPDPPVNGDIYIVENDTPTINLTWVMAGGVTSASKDDRIIWNAADSDWILIPGGGGGGGTITAIIGSDPIQVDSSSDASRPVVSVDEATITQNGVVARLAGPADVIHTNLSPSDTAVVTADLLQATNKIVSNNPWMRDDQNKIIKPTTDGDNITITGADGSVNISLNADGSSVYEGLVQLKDSVYIGASPNIQLFAGGSSKFGGTLSVGTSTSNADQNITLNANGSATFAGGIDISFPGVNSDPGGARYLNFNNEDSTLVANQPMGGITWTGNDSNNPGVQNAAIVAYSSSNSGLVSSIAFKIGTSETARLTSGGDFLVGGTLPSAANITLNADGSITATGQIRTNNKFFAIDPVGIQNSRLTIEPTDDAVLITANNTAATGRDIFFDLGSSGNSLNIGGSTSAPNIELNESGSAKFNGSITIGDNPYAGAGTGTFVSPSGVFRASAVTGSPLWQGYLNGTTGATSSITSQGTASFAGIVTSGLINTSSTTAAGCLLNSGGILTAQRTAASGSGANVFQGYSGTNKTTTITAGGSATFAGSLDAASIDCGTY